MYLTRHHSPKGKRWALNGYYLPYSFSLENLLALPQENIPLHLKSLPPSGAAVDDPLLPPIERGHEVWACGVTYLRSRQAREIETETKNIYEKVYLAERPEIFYKASGWRVVGHKMPVRIRVDSHWNVPEPELTLVVNAHQEIVGFCAGNDMSSRDIEGANPLYLPQAKIYNGSCAIGPGIQIGSVEQIRDAPIEMEIIRSGETIYQGETRSSQMKRSFEQLVEYLTMEMDFPNGVFVMTGTGIVPSEDFSLQPGDVTRIRVGSLELENTVDE